MHIESLDQAVELLKNWQLTRSAYQHALGVLELDAATAAPSGSWEGRGKTVEVLSQAEYALSSDSEKGELLAFLEAHRSDLDAQTRRETEVLRKQYDQLHRIPAEEYTAYCVLINDAQGVWHQAKRNDDFQSFAPYLEKIVAYNRRFAGYYNPKMAPYDALLNEYEEGMTTQVLDDFFAKLRDCIVPLLRRVTSAQQVDDSFLYGSFPVDKQSQLSDYLMDIMGLNRTYCGIAQTEHPFTTNFSNKDVRITTHYYEDNAVSSMYSVIHEGGHALYELGCDDCYNFTALSGGVSMGMHESQSRFYENIIGRSKPFIHAIMPKLRELFPDQLGHMDEDAVYRAVNRVEPSLIRTESDELTYCLHVMVRYELEKRLIDGSLEVSDLPQAWNQLYREYLGVEVPNDSKGCLQDSHWSSGSIGYFPSYALGSAYGPQLLKKMEEDLGDIWPDVAKGDLSRITQWLREHIHRFASFYKSRELFEKVCGSFDPTFYTDYLKEKYEDLYQI